jgi:ATP-dependent protease ClpP protease subunit
LSLHNRLLTEKKDERDGLQKDLLKQIQKTSKRKTLAYYANFNAPPPYCLINSEDKSRIIMLCDSLPKSTKEIDFIINSPGGYAESVEMIVSILRNRFDNIRFIIPHSAKSAATMLTLSGDTIMMGPGSELGPIDPQIDVGGVSGPAQNIVDGFEEIYQRVKNEGELNPAFIPLLEKMDISLIRMCRDASKYGEDLVCKWLKEYMLKKEKNRGRKARRIAKYFSTHGRHKTHSRPIFRDEARKIGVKNIRDLEQNKPLNNMLWEHYMRNEFIFMNPVIAKIFQSEKEYMIKLSPTVQIQNPVPVAKKQQKSS